MRFQKTVRDIQSLKIQGAEKIAKEAVRAMNYAVRRSKAHTVSELYSELRHSAKQLAGARPTEPCLRNAMKFVINGLDKKDLVSLTKSLDQQTRLALRYFDNAEKAVALFGSKKIRRGYVVFTHCHSSTVMMVLAKAKFNGTRFEVHNCETRPLFQGRKTAKELSALGIKVSHYIDSAVRLALKKTDLFLFGADAIQSDGRIINKIGTELFLEIARKYDIPTYCCTVTWKFDPKTLYGVDEPIENRNPNEVWGRAPKKVTIMNPAFEIIDPELVTGVITELGVFKPETLVDEIHREQRWMFQ